MPHMNCSSKIVGTFFEHLLCTNPMLSTFSSVQSLSHVQLFVTPWTAASPASLSVTNSRVLPKLMCIESVMSSNHLILCCPFLLLSQHQGLFKWVNSSYQVANYWSFIFINPSMNTQDWSPLRLTDWISLKSKGLSRVFFNANSKASILLSLYP